MFWFLFIYAIVFLCVVLLYDWLSCAGFSMPMWCALHGPQRGRRCVECDEEKIFGRIVQHFA